MKHDVVEGHEVILPKSIRWGRSPAKEEGLRGSNSWTLQM